MGPSRRVRQRRWVAAVLCALWVRERAAVAAPEQASPCDESSKPGGKESDRLDRCQSSSVEITLAFASAYIYRGYNVFQTEHQGDQNWVARPRIIWTDSSEKVSLGYTAAYQLNGDNLWDNVSSGVGSDQVLFADYDFTPIPRVVVSPEVGLYLYPQALDVPVLVEASAEVWYQGLIDVGAYAGYLGALRPGPLSEDYLYLSPRLAKSFKFGRRIALGMQLIAGAKLFRQHSDSLDNTVDLLVAGYLRYDLTDVFFVSMKSALAWTNLEPREDPVTHALKVPGFVDECAPFWGFTLGAEL
jgi:hypothetical protein